MTEDELRVLTANEAFYDAFSARDGERMDALWARATAVTCLHPGWSALVGRGPVMESWRAILGSPGSPRLEATGARAFVVGEAAWVLCYEGPRGGPAMLVATNVFVREGGEWKIAHHQAGQVAVPPEPEPPEGSN